MMKKITTIFVALMFIMSIVPMVFADGDDSTSNSGDDNTKPMLRQSDNSAGRPIINKLREDQKVKIEKLQDRNRVKVQNLREDYQAKIANLKEDEMNKIADLSQSGVAKMARLGENGVSNIARLERASVARIANLKQDNINKIATLDHAKVQKLANLKEDQLRKIAGLKDEEVGVIAGLVQAKLDKVKDFDRFKLKKLGELKEDEAGKIASLSREKVDSILKLSRDKIEKLKGMTEYDLKAYDVDAELVKEKLQNAKQFKARVIQKAHVEKVKNAYEDHKADYERAKQSYSNAKPMFVQARNNYKKICADNEDSGECVAVKDEMLEKSSTYLIGQADMVLETVGKLKSQVEASEALDEEKAEEIIAELEDLEAKVEESKLTLEDATTVEDLKLASEDLKEVWKDLKEELKEKAEKLKFYKVAGILQRSKHLELRFDKLVEKLDEQGIDAGEEMPEFIDQFKAALDSAESHWNEAKEYFEKAESAKTDDPTDEERATVHEYIQEARKHLQMAHSQLNIAHKNLVEMFKIAHRLGVAEEVTDVVTDEEFEEEATEIESGDIATTAA